MPTGEKEGEPKMGGHVVATADIVFILLISVVGLWAALMPPKRNRCVSLTLEGWRPGVGSHYLPPVIDPWPVLIVALIGLSLTVSMLFGIWHRVHVAVFVISTIALFCYEYSLSSYARTRCLNSGIDPWMMLFELSTGEWNLTRLSRAKLEWPLDTEVLRAIAESSASVVVGRVWDGCDASERRAAATADALGLVHVAEFLRRESRGRSLPKASPQPVSASEQGDEYHKPKVNGGKSIPRRLRGRRLIWSPELQEEILKEWNKEEITAFIMGELVIEGF
jgi:hypothetical protein